MSLSKVINKILLLYQLVLLLLTIRLIIFNNHIEEKYRYINLGL